MKRITALILFAVVYSLADSCGLQYPIVEITFKDSSLWRENTHSFFDAGPVLLNGQLTYILEDGYNCENPKYEKAFIDTNTYLRKDYGTGNISEWRIVDIGQNDLSTYNMGDVFKDEFMHWQQCGMLSLNYEEADSLGDYLAKVIDDMFDNLNWSETDAFIVDDYPMTGGSAPAQFVDWAKKDCATVSITPLEKPAKASIAFEKGTVFIPEFLRGEKYFVFDMNGRVIKKGTAGETIRMPTSPAILKIGLEKLVLQK